MQKGEVAKRKPGTVRADTRLMIALSGLSWSPLIMTESDQEFKAFHLAFALALCKQIHNAALHGQQQLAIGLSTLLRIEMLHHPIEAHQASIDTTGWH